MNTLVQFCGEHTCSVLCRFFSWTLDLLLYNIQFSSTFDSLVWYVPRLWNCSQFNKNTCLSQWPFHIKHKPNMNYLNKSRCTASWLAKTTMTQIVPSLQLAKTKDYILTPYTFDCLIENFSAYSILHAALFSAASPAERLHSADSLSDMSDIATRNTGNNGKLRYNLNVNNDADYVLYCFLLIYTYSFGSWWKVQRLKSCFNFIVS